MSFDRSPTLSLFFYVNIQLFVTLRIRIRMDPHWFGAPDPDPHWFGAPDPDPHCDKKLDPDPH
jgi:hypothetical protein